MKNCSRKNLSGVDSRGRFQLLKKQKLLLRYIAGFFGLLLILPIMLGSCSAYKKVSLNNFNKYDISLDERSDLQYVLKKHKLHYADMASRNNINFYKEDESTIRENYSFLIENNVEIPTGARGLCVDSQDDQLIVEFGEGINVPFMLYNKNNRPKVKIMVNGKVYNLEVSYRIPRLYFYQKESASWYVR